MVSMLCEPLEGCQGPCLYLLCHDYSTVALVWVSFMLLDCKPQYLRCFGSYLRQMYFVAASESLAFVYLNRCGYDSYDLSKILGMWWRFKTL